MLSRAEKDYFYSTRLQYCLIHLSFPPPNANSSSAGLKKKKIPLLSQWFILRDIKPSFVLICRRHDWINNSKLSKNIHETYSCENRMLPVHVFIRCSTFSVVNHSRSEIVIFFCHYKIVKILSVLKKLNIWKKKKKAGHWGGWQITINCIIILSLKATMINSVR